MTDPYVDAMTGDICFTVSVLLGDSDTVLAMDYTMETIQSHIRQTYGDDSKHAVIVTGDGIIAGCTDECMVGKVLAYELPAFSGIFGQVKAQQGFVSTHVRSGLHSESLFATSSGFGWHLIVSENEWDLYKDAYLQFIGNVVAVVALMALIIALFLATERHERETRAQVAERDATLQEIADRLIGTLTTLLEADDPTDSQNPSMSDDLALIRTAGRQILEAVQGIWAPNDKKKENESTTYHGAYGQKSTPRT